MACDDLITNQDLENAKKDATTMSDFVESDSPEIKSKNGKNIRTLQGINDAADNLISSLGGVDIGDYENDETLNSYNEYVVFDRAGLGAGPSLWKAIPPRTPTPGTPLPYTIDSTTYPDPTSDPNIEPFSDINKAGAEQISDDFDNNRQKETAGLSDITEASNGLDIFPLIGQGLRVAGVGLWVVPSVTADGSPMPNPANLDAIPTNENAAINGGTSITLQDQALIKFKTLDSAINSVLKAGSIVSIKERTEGNGGASTWDVALTSDVTPNTYNVVQSIADPSISLVLRVQYPLDVRAWGAQLDGVFDDSGAIQAIDNYIGTFVGGVIPFPEGTLSIGSTINKSIYTHWVGSVANNYFEDSNTDWDAGTRIRPLFDGVLISSSYVSGNTLAGYCGLENFSCAGRIEDTGNFDNVVIYRQSGDRVSGLKFKNLIFKRAAKGIEIGNASFCSFENLDFRCKENIDAPTISDSEFIRCEVGSGLPSDPTLKASLSGGYGLRMIGDNSAGSPFNGNNKFHRCRFQVAADTFTNLRAEWMLNLKFFDCIFDQNEAQGGVFLNSTDIEFHGCDGFNNATSTSERWCLQFGQGGSDGCKNVKFFGGRFYNKSMPNANPNDGDGLLFSDTSDYELHGTILDDTLVTKISGLSLSSRIYGGDIPTSVDLTLQNSWVENSGVSTPRARKESNVCYVSGAIKDGTRTNGTLIFTLPEGYRPSRSKYVPTFSGPAPEPEWLFINTNGEATIAGGDWSAASLNGIDFMFDLIN